MQRPAPTRLGALSCPSCGARRILTGMLYCDQCGKRIPDSLIAKLGHSDAAALSKELPSNETAAGPTKAAQSSRSLDVAGASVRVTSLSDSSAKSQAGATMEGQQMRYGSVDASSSTLVGRQRILGVSLVGFGVLVAVASALIGAENLSGLGLGSFLIGLLLVYLGSRSSFSSELVEASLLSSLVNVERILRELGPTCKAIYVRTADRLDVPMVFLPMEENPDPSSELDLSGVDRLLVIDSRDSHKTGLLLEAPGASLLALMEKELGLDFTDLDNEGFLNAIRSGLVDSLEVAADVKGAIAIGGAKLRIKDGPLNGLSESIQRMAPNVASRLGCPICSAAICAMTKVVKRNMVLQEATHQSGIHLVTLRFGRGSTDETS